MENVRGEIMIRYISLVKRQSKRIIINLSVVIITITVMVFASSGFVMADVISSKVQESSNIIVEGKFRVKPEKREELLSLVSKLIKPSRKDPGSIRYYFMEDTFDKNSFLFFEEWLSKDSLDQHFETKHFKEFMKVFPNLVQEDLQIQIHPAS